MRKRTTVMLLAAVGAVSLAPMAYCAGISVDFYGTGGGGGTLQAQMAPSEMAGVIPLTNWNSLAPPPPQAANGTPGSQPTPQPLVDDLGAATGATVSWAAAGTWNVNHVQAPGDLRMMKGYIDTNDTSITAVSVTGLPASLIADPYAVILYYDGDNGTQARVGKYSIDADAGDLTLWGRDAGGAFVGAYVLGASPIDPLPGATGTMLDNQGVAALTVPAGNFMIFPGVMGSSFTLSAQASVSAGGTNRAAIQGIQIVPMSAIPEPGSMAVLGLAAVGLAGWRRRA